jgi:hypothetical protein
MSETGYASPTASSDGILVTSPPTVTGAKSHLDGVPIAIESAVVTAKFSQFIYVEQPDRTSGIKVNGTTDADTDALVSITGVVDTLDGERFIRDPSITPQGTLNTSLGSLAMGNKSVGGSALNDKTPGVTGGTGVNNIGLLVRTWGRIVYVSEDYFLIDDGSKVESGATLPGLIVQYPLPMRVPSSAMVAVTGISTVKKSDTGVFLRVIKPRSDLDIQDY